LKECRFEIPYPIKVVRFGEPEILGSIEKETILLGVNSLDKGKHETLNTIIEEYIHLKHGSGDCTRGFQTASINELINYMKLVNAYNL